MEKEGEEKVKKPRFPSILGPQRRPSRIEAASGESALSDGAETTTLLFKLLFFPSNLDPVFFPSSPSAFSRQSLGRSPAATEAVVSAVTRGERSHGRRASPKQPVERGLGTHALHVDQRLDPEQRRLRLGRRPRRRHG